MRGTRSGSAAPRTPSSVTTSAAWARVPEHGASRREPSSRTASSAFLLRTAEANAAELDRHHAGDGEAWNELLAEFFPNADLAFGVLGTELWSRHGAGLGVKAVRRLGRRGAVAFAGALLVSARDWLETAFASERAHGLLAPWVLHTGLGPDAAASGYMAQVIAVAVQEGGMPIPRGGGARLADALVALIRERGGTCETGVHVVRVFAAACAPRRRAVGAARAVICNVTPTQLYGDLLEGFADRADRFRYGRSEMQIHFALSEPPRWDGDERLGQTAIVHVTPGLDGVSRAVNEAERGLLPAEATVVAGQPLTMDPSRAPEGKGILWVQLQELPWRVKGDAAGELDVGDGTWTESLRERYADRIQARLARHIPNLESSILARTRSFAGGSRRRRMSIFATAIRTAARSRSTRTSSGGRWRRSRVIGRRSTASGTWAPRRIPGPGLGGGSGALVAAQLLEPPLDEADRGAPSGAEARPGPRLRRLRISPPPTRSGEDAPPRRRLPFPPCAPPSRSPRCSRLGGSSVQAAPTVCAAAGGKAPVAKPRFVRTIATGETGWFSSPGLADLNGDGKLEIVAPFYSTFVFDAKGRLLGKGTATKGRVYAPGRRRRPRRRQASPRSSSAGTTAPSRRTTSSAGGCGSSPAGPRRRAAAASAPRRAGMAAADLDGDGRVEVVVTTTNTSSTGSQVFVFDAAGKLFHPKGAPATAWPRFNTLHGKGNDADFNGAGNHGYGAYGENVGIGNLDDDPQLEIVVTFDNHQINVFNDDGTSVLASPWYTNRDSAHAGPPARLGAVHPLAEPGGRGRPVPPPRRPVARRPQDDVAAVDGLAAVDRRPRRRRAQRGDRPAERREEGAVRDAGLRVHGARRRAARRRALGAAARGIRDAAADRQARRAARRRLVPAERDPRADARRHLRRRAGRRSSRRCPTASSTRSARPASGSGATTTRTARPKTFASEVVAADLNRDGTPELVFGTYALTPQARAGSSCSPPRASSSTTFACRTRAATATASASPAAPSIGDLDGDGRLEIVLTTFDHGIDVFRVPGSGTNCLPWPTGRGNLLRNGTG